MANRPVTILVKKKQTTGGVIPGSALMGEPFVNLFDGVLKFSATTGGSFESSSQTNVFEVGSTLYNQKISNRLSINDKFIVSGNTGIISTYSGVTGAGLAGTFLSGTSAGYVIANIADIATSTDSYTTGATWVPNTLTLKLNQGKPNVTVVIDTFNSLSVTGNSTLNTLSATTVSGGTIYSGSTDIYNIFVNKVNAGSNITIGGTAISPVVNITASPSFNNITFSGTATGGALSATSISAATSIYSAGTSLETIIYNIANTTENITSIGNGLNTYTGGTPNLPTVNVSALTINNITVSGASNFVSLSAGTLSGGTIFSGSTNIGTLFATPANITLINSQLLTKANLSGATFTGAISATAITDTALTSGWAVYAGSGGLLKTTSGFTYDEVAKRLYTENIQVGSSSLSGTVDIWGDVIVHGQSISAFTSQLYVEDNNIQLNFNPTANTTSTSLGAGFTIQDGSGLAGTDVFWDIRGTSTGVANRGFATNLNDIYIRESGTTSSPGGVRVIAEYDIIDGGTY